MTKDKGSEELEQLITELCNYVAQKVYEFIYSKVPRSKIRHVNVSVSFSQDIFRSDKKIVDIDVYIETTPFIRQEYINQIVDQATEYGLKVAEELFKKYGLIKGEYLESEGENREVKEDNRRSRQHNIDYT